jgi:DNA recombination protein RmuC
VVSGLLSSAAAEETVIETSLTVIAAIIALVVIGTIAAMLVSRRWVCTSSRFAEFVQNVITNLRSESAASRSELATELGRSREENRATLASLQSTLDDRAHRLDATFVTTLDRLREGSEQRIELLRRDLLDRQERIREEAETNRRLLREEIATSLSTTTTTLLSSVTEFSSLQRGEMETFGKQIGSLIEGNDRRFDSLQLSMQNRLGEIDSRMTDTLDKSRAIVEQKLDASSHEILERHDRMRDEASAARHQQREEISSAIRGANDTMMKGIESSLSAQARHFETFGAQIGQLFTSNETRFDALRVSVENRLTEIRDRNAEQIDQMRATVDEKLQGTLDKRLGESFKQVSERLEIVHRGLGEMQAIAAGVGDLKRVLTNVKNRGGWGEIQLESLLDQLLTQDQYKKNVPIKGGAVEFAICFPSRGEDEGTTYLPIDAKFPMNDYQRLLDAQEKGDSVAVEVEANALEQAVKKCAKDISEKYIDPPQTTDFAIMYLPLEGLFAEVIRRPGLMEKLQVSFRVTVAGPTTLTAMLNSLQMGFRTLAIQKRSSEVWKILGAVKTEFGNFATILEKVDKQINTVAKTVTTAAAKSRTIERKLRSVEQLPTEDAKLLLPEEETVEEDPGEMVTADDEWS